jgi:hypothetical protein
MDQILYGVLATMIIAEIGAIGYLAYMLNSASLTITQEELKKITSAELKIKEEPEKAKPAWDLGRVILEAYFNRNLLQIRSIYWVSISVMVFGFMIIIVGIYQAAQNPDALAPAVLAGVAGIITEFIGATFLFVFKSTMQQASDYSKTLERINSVGMAMAILDTMPDECKEDDLKNKTKSILVELLVKQAHDTQSSNSIKTQ